jgi:hypothetical protein
MAIKTYGALVVLGTGLVAAACGSSEEDAGLGSAAGAAGSSAGAAGSATGGGGGVASTGGAGGTSGTGAVGGSAGTPATGGAPGAELRFVAFGDCGKGNDGQKEVAAAVRAKCQTDGCDFIQMLGDNLYDSGAASVDDPIWQLKFEQPYANLTYPFWVVLGNHDYGGGGAGFEVARANVQVAYSQKSNKWKLPAKHYKHPEPGVDFIALDTNESMFNAHATQKSNVSKWIGESSAEWTIAVGHHPYLSNGPHGNAGSYDNLPFVPIVNGKGVKDLLDTSVCGKVDVYISGHDHSLQWMTGTCQGTELLVSGGGASNTDMPGKNPTHYQGAHLGFLYVVIKGKTFTGEFIDAQGNVKFTRTITKT